MYGYVDVDAQCHYCKFCGRGKPALDVIQESMDYIPTCENCGDDIDVPLTDHGIDYYMERAWDVLERIEDCTEPDTRMAYYQTLHAYQDILRDNGASVYE